MKTLAVWIAALGVSALGANAAGAQSMTLTSPEISESTMIANEQVLAGFGCSGSYSTFRPRRLRFQRAPAT
jgi:hypothetical protein